jgi:hypothetical protein
MKNNYKLQIICLLCVIIAAFSGCKKDELAQEKGLTGNHKNLAIQGDGEWDLLGYGYDMTGELFSSNSVSDAAIIDVGKFNADYPNRINTPTGTHGYYAVYSGANAYDYMKDVNDKETWGLTANGGEKDTNTYASMNFSKTNENQNTYTYNGKYSYASFESRVRIKSINFTGDATVDILKNYLTPLFIANLSNYSADALIERYGTHVLLGISIGGRLKYDYRGSIVSETTATRKLDAIKAGFSIGVDKIFGVNLSSDHSTEEKITISNETIDKTFIGTYYGGTNSGTSFSTDAAGNTSQNVNLAGWQSSITVNNATLIDINNAVPIYDLIADPIKKEQVKVAVEKYISDRRIKLNYSKLQLYNFYSTPLGHIFTVDPNFPAKNPGTWRRIINDPIYVYESQIPGSVPVYIMQHRTRSIYCLTRDNTIDLDIWAPTNYPVFYAYDNQVQGTVPIHQFYHPNKPGDGYFYDLTLNPTWNGWIENTTKFYAFNNAN